MTRRVALAPLFLALSLLAVAAVDDYDGDGYSDSEETGALLVDANLSGRVDGFDLAWLGREWGTRSVIPVYDGNGDPILPFPPNPDFVFDLDFTRDGTIDGDELSLLAVYFGHEPGGVVPPPPDATPPTAPSGLVATPVSSSGIDLSWTASTDNVGVTGYRVERCTGSSCTTFAQIGTSVSVSYADTGLAAETTYRYRVRAQDAAANLSSYSATASATTPEGGGDPTTWPLVQRDDISYLGSFAVPASDGEENPLAYGGHALGYNAANHSLFFGCHDWYQLLAEVSIPAIGGTASILRNCTDVTEGTLGDVDPGEVNGIKLGGNLAHNGRLVTSAFTYYDADGTQTLTHGVSSNLDLYQTGNFDGWYEFDGVDAYPRALGGYMTPIPAEWQDLFGGPAFTGQGSLSIIGSSSDGPSATVFDPDDVGVAAMLTGTTVVFYPIDEFSHPDFGAKGSMLAGMAFPRSTRSVLFFGTRAQHDYCYGTPEECPYSCFPYKGPQNEYKHAIWAYDANDLLRVKNGEIEPWQVMPYATWEFDDITSGNCASTRYGGAAFDPEGGMLYVVEAFGENPEVHVFRIGSGP